MEMTRQRRPGIGRRMLAVLILAGVLTSGLSGIVAAQDGPAFDTVTLSASSVARGGMVTVSAHITDKTADVLEAPTIYFLLPDGADGPATDFTRVSGDARDGRYSATVAISPLLPPGQYTVRLLRAYDGDGNIATVTPPDPRLVALTLTVTGGDIASVPGMATAVTTMAAAPAAGTMAPIAGMTASTVPTPAASATRGGLTAVTATAAGTRFPQGTGMPASTATASQPMPPPMFSPIPIVGSGPDLTGAPTPMPTIAARVTVLPVATSVATATRTMTALAAPATATPQPSLLPVVTAMAPARSTATAPPTHGAPAVIPTARTSATTPAAATVTPTARQTTAAPATATAAAGPILASLSVSDATVYPAGALIVTARITDSAADITDFPTLRYRLPDGTDGPFAYLRRVDGTTRDGTYQAVVGLSPFVPPGTYMIAALTIRDTDGNTIVFSSPIPPQPDATFVVEPFVPSTPTPASSDAG